LLATMDRRELVEEVLREVIDPHTGVSVYDMGLISELAVNNDAVSLTFMPTSPFCPVGVELAKAIREKILSIEGMKRCDIKVVGHIRADQINKELSAQPDV
jgi:metal-sulfur cluster biosynthetic enzyme